MRETLITGILYYVLDYFVLFDAFSIFVILILILIFIYFCLYFFKFPFFPFNFCFYCFQFLLSFLCFSSFIFSFFYLIFFSSLLFRYQEDALAFSSTNVLKNKILRLENRKEIIEKKFLAVPEILKTLAAFQFYEKSDRACADLTGVRTPVTYSDCTCPMGAVRAAMLMVLSALPMGSIDDQVIIDYCPNC